MKEGITSRSTKHSEKTKKISKNNERISVDMFFLFSVSFYNIEVKAGDLRIIDGDTIILHGEKIRFSGIDAPELKQTCIKYDQPVYCGILAKEVLLKRIGNKIPTCIKEGKDFYNRFLAECFINESSLSRYLVRSGYAFAYRKYSTKIY